MICVVCLFASDRDTPLAELREAVTVVSGMATCAEHIAGLVTTQVSMTLARAHTSVKAAQS